MVRVHFRIASLCAIGLCLALSGSAFAQKLYKWVDKDGNVFYSDQVPPDHKDYAREELNDSGVVVDAVDRAKTEEEIAEQKRQERLAEEAREEAEKQRRKDRVVLNSYTSEEDIVRQRDSQIESINRLIAMTEAAMVSEQQSLNRLVSRAAELERTGRPVTDALKSQIENLRSRITDQKALVARREAEKAAVKDNYKTEIARYREVVNRNNPNT